jgi:hypothetical protein
VQAAEHHVPFQPELDQAAEMLVPFPGLPRVLLDQRAERVGQSGAGF